ncbi:MAG: hypothetical protein CL678_18480 [Bdellovibrionaceae bacterium]|nr:hypothetical protein [Pseudobdellovibrionaceae bacterium]|tara:strand:+ start:1685 stop:2296 length:612 start_codon:yes stop_codon:yes gene_type:complete
MIDSKIFILALGTFYTLSGFSQDHSISYFMKANVDSHLFSSSNKTKKTSYIFKKNQIIASRDNEKIFNENITQLKKSKNLWKKITVQKKSSQRNFFILINNSNFEILNDSKEIELKIIIPKEKEVIPLTQAPKKELYQNCLKNPESCNAWPHRRSKIILLDTYLDASNKKLELYYKVSYEYRTSLGLSKKGIGWIQSRYAIKK